MCALIVFAERLTTAIFDGFANNPQYVAGIVIRNCTTPTLTYVLPAAAAVTA